MRFETFYEQFIARDDNAQKLVDSGSEARYTAALIPISLAGFALFTLTSESVAIQNFYWFLSLIMLFFVACGCSIELDAGKKRKAWFEEEDYEALDKNLFLVSRQAEKCFIVVRGAMFLFFAVIIAVDAAHGYYVQAICLSFGALIVAGGRMEKSKSLETRREQIENGIGVAYLEG